MSLFIYSVYRDEVQFPFKYTMQRGQPLKGALYIGSSYQCSRNEYGKLSVAAGTLPVDWDLELFWPRIDSRVIR